MSDSSDADGGASPGDPYKFKGGSDSESGADTLGFLFKSVETRWDFWGQSERYVHYPAFDSSNEDVLRHIKASQTGQELDILVYYGGRPMDTLDYNLSDFRSFEMFNLFAGTQILSYHSIASAGPVTFGGIKTNRPYYVTKGTESDTNWFQEFNPITLVTFQTEFQQQIFADCGMVWDNKSRFFFVGGCESDSEPKWHYSMSNAFYWDTLKYEKHDVAPMVEGRRNPTVIMDPYKRVLVIGGFEKKEQDNSGFGDDTLDTVEIFDIAHNRWLKGSRTNVSKSNAAAVYTENTIFLSGGKGPLKATAICESKSTWNDRDPWTLMPSLKKARHGHSMAYWNGSLIVLGGVDKDEKPVLEIEMYNFGEDKWKVVGKIEKSRYKGVIGLIKVWMNPEPDLADTGKEPNVRKRALSTQEMEALTRRRLHGLERDNPGEASTSGNVREDELAMLEELFPTNAK